VTDYLTASLRDLKREVFKVIFLDKGLRILGEKDMFFGTVDEAAVHPREIVKEALLQNASSLVLIHNLCVATHKLCYVEFLVMWSSERFR